MDRKVPVCLRTCVFIIDTILAFQQQKDFSFSAFFFVVVAVSVESFTLFIPKTTFSLSSLITFSLPKSYTK